MSKRPIKKISKITMNLGAHELFFKNTRASALESFSINPDTLKKINSEMHTTRPEKKNTSSHHAPS